MGNKENKITKKDDTTKIKDKKTEESEKTTPEGDNDKLEEIPKQIPNKEQKKEELADQSKEKKEKCPYWENNGRCKFGEICRLEHKNICKNIMEYGECNKITCEMKHPEVYYNIQYYNYCPRTDTDCKFVHPKNRQGKQVRKQNLGSYNQKYNKNQEPSGCN